MCYLGFARMETALKALGVQTDDVEYTPFLIRPSLSEDDTVDRAVLAQLKNGKEQADELFCELNEEAREFGICFVNQGPIRSTLLSHRFLAEAYARGGWPLQRKLLRAHFVHHHEQGGDIGAMDANVRMAVDAGLFESERSALEFGQSTARQDDVERAIFQARSRGIQGVPFIELEHNGNRATLRGAVDPTPTIRRVMGL